MQKWTDEQRRKFKATMRQKRENKPPITTKLIEELPVRHTPYNGHGPNNDAEEFAKFMAAAWRIFKHGN